VSGGGTNAGKLRITIATTGGEVLETLIIYRERAELPIAEEARRVLDFLQRRYDYEVAA
jgi:hypothetical protein